MISESAANSTPTRGKVVVKVGTSSITHDGGSLNEEAMDRLLGRVLKLRDEGHQVVMVSSAAIAAGMARLGLDERPKDFESLQALSAVGQVRLMEAYDRLAAARGCAVGQVLLAPPDFFERGRYLRARSCIEAVLEHGALPIINENDAVADDAIRFGDNDRISALVAQLIGADLLVLLTDTDGLFTADPNLDDDASLIEEIAVVDAEIEKLAGGSRSSMSQGGMASKLSAAKIASWSGVRVVIASAERDGVLQAAVRDEPGAGTVVRPRDATLSARKLWIAFARGVSGRLHVDAGAQKAIVERGTSLLPVGIVRIDGEFLSGDAVDIVGPDGDVFARGLARQASAEMGEAIGYRSDEMSDGRESIAIHRDDLVVLPSATKPTIDR